MRGIDKKVSLSEPIKTPPKMYFFSVYEIFDFYNSIYSRQFSASNATNLRMLSFFCHLGQKKTFCRLPKKLNDNVLLSLGDYN